VDGPPELLGCFLARLHRFGRGLCSRATLTPLIDAEQPVITVVSGAGAPETTAIKGGPAS